MSTSSPFNFSTLFDLSSEGCSLHLRKAFFTSNTLAFFTARCRVRWAVWRNLSALEYLAALTIDRDMKKAFVAASSGLFIVAAVVVFARRRRRRQKRLRCDTCGTCFPSRSSLFKHLQSAHFLDDVGKKKKHATHAAQIGYYWRRSPRESESVESYLAQVMDLRSLASSPKGERAALRQASGCGSWADVATFCGTLRQRTFDFGPLVVHILSVYELKKRGLASCATTRRVEVLVPRNLFADDSYATLRAIRNSCLVRDVSWHNFGDAVEGARPPCPRKNDERVAKVHVKKVECKFHGEFLCVALTGEFLCGMPSRLALVAVARFHNWQVPDNIFDESGLIEFERPPSVGESLASVRVPSFENRAGFVLDGMRRGDVEVEQLRDRVRANALERIEELEQFYRSFATRERPGRVVEPPAPLPSEMFRDALEALRNFRQTCETSEARASRMLCGESISVGSTPSHQKAPKHALDVVWSLEKAIIAAKFPHRAPSTMCAVNFGARFAPHLDSGAGDGQSPSLLVSFGDFTGGELVVEHRVHDCRHNPIQFDGYRQRHWTLPFEGERFSLVWFSPLERSGCKEPNHARSPQEATIFQVSGDHLFLRGSQREALNPRPGFVVLKQFLDEALSREILDALNDKQIAFTRPTYANGHSIHCHMACLGRRWNASTGEYEDGEDVPGIPESLEKIASNALRACVAIDPTNLSETNFDVCIANFYEKKDGKMGAHQDLAERDLTAPVLSISLGFSGHFVFGDERLRLESGDVVAFGGPSRLAKHGVERVSQPKRRRTSKSTRGGFRMRPGRLNLTFRKSRA